MGWAVWAACCTRHIHQFISIGVKVSVKVHKSACNPVLEPFREIECFKLWIFNTRRAQKRSILRRMKNAVRLDERHKAGCLLHTLQPSSHSDRRKCKGAPISGAASGMTSSSGADIVVQVPIPFTLVEETKA
jgi:hypothetical protein